MTVQTTKRRASLSCCSRSMENPHKKRPRDCGSMGYHNGLGEPHAKPPDATALKNATVPFRVPAAFCFTRLRLRHV